MAETERNTEGDKATARNYPLTAADSEKVQAWIKSKWTSDQCPRCGHPDWWVVDAVLVAPELPTSSRPLVGGHPFVQLICQNCGHLEALMAEVVGLDLWRKDR